MNAALLAGLITLGALPASADPYRFYGGAIPEDEKNPAIEACEYAELVERQRCNERINKSECIKEVHRECRERFGDGEQAPAPADIPEQDRAS